MKIVNIKKIAKNCNAKMNNVKKIRHAKEIIERMTNPPSLNDLAKEVEISVKNLKEGFKKIEFIDETIKDSYLEKFKIYCLVFNNKKSQAQLLLDLFYNKEVFLVKIFFLNHSAFCLTQQK